MKRPLITSCIAAVVLASSPLLVNAGSGESETDNVPLLGYYDAQGVYEPGYVNYRFGIEDPAAVSDVADIDTLIQYSAPAAGPSQGMILPTGSMKTDGSYEPIYVNYTLY